MQNFLKISAVLVLLCTLAFYSSAYAANLDGLPGDAVSVPISIPSSLTDAPQPMAMGAAPMRAAPPTTIASGPALTPEQSAWMTSHGLSTAGIGQGDFYAHRAHLTLGTEWWDKAKLRAAIPDLVKGAEFKNKYCREKLAHMYVDGFSPLCLPICFSCCDVCPWSDNQGIVKYRVCCPDLKSRSWFNALAAEELDAGKRFLLELRAQDAYKRCCYISTLYGMGCCMLYSHYQSITHPKQT